MKLRAGIFICILMIASQAVFGQNNNPSFRAQSGTYYFTKNKPIVLKWGDTHFFKDSTYKAHRVVGDTSDNYTVTSVVDTKYAKADISIYPNPFISTINIKYDKEGELKVELIDITGKYSMSKVLSSGERQIDLSGLASSSYLLKVYDSGGTLLQTFRIEKVQ
jgi:hypothetical protein